ncbi:MAG: hypothetical protein LBT02_04025 [Rickettsiales bacterium]|nr:hypothetical protein [Rickettsiales bacterium]
MKLTRYYFFIAFFFISSGIFSIAYL